MYENIIFYSSLTLSFIIYNSINYRNKEINGLNKENFKKMHKILYDASNLKKDIYKRKLNKKVIWKFLKLCNKYNIDVNNINDNKFDFIYKKYVEYQINKYETL